MAKAKLSWVGLLILSGMLAVLLAVVFIAMAVKPDPKPENVDWIHHGSDSQNTRYSPLDQINAENFKEVEVAWRWKSIETRVTENNSAVRAGGFKATPLVVGGMMYVVTSVGQIVALDPGTGDVLWEFDPESYKAGRPTNFGFQHRGVSYWSDGDDSRIIIATHDRKLWALDAKTGEPESDFADGGPVDLETSLGRPIRPNTITHNSPVGIAGDTIIVGSSIFEGHTKESTPGHIRGFDVRTGEMKWIFHTIPQEGEYGVETWEDESWKYSGNTNVWGMFSVDEELGYVYAPVSSPTNDFYGGHRLGDNLFGESLVCIDAETGKYVWHFQMVHHPLWDYDLPAAPNLVDIVVDGRRIKAVAQVTKQAFCYVFDRVTGEPVWPIEERPVPQSTVPGERTSPTQPFPAKPAPFDRQGLTEDDLVDFTPRLRAMAVAALEGFQIGGLYTPPNETTGTFGFPSANGGANWPGAAFDPESGVLYVPSSTYLGSWKVEVPDPNRSNMRYITQHFPLDTLDRNGNRGIPWSKPPYSRVTAIDLNTGDHFWMTPHGDGPLNHPWLKDLNLPPLGQTGGSKGGPMVTKSLLFVTIVGARNGTEADKTPRISVFDKKTGELLGVIPLPGDPYGNPMTYLHNGKQYIAVAVGGQEIFSNKMSSPAEIVALSLP